MGRVACSRLKDMIDWSHGIGVTRFQAEGSLALWHRTDVSTIGSLAGTMHISDWFS